MSCNENGTDELEFNEINIIKWEEVSIDIGWGILRGKKLGYGSRKILGLHGWLDNANTFDLIVPRLPNDITLLSLDLPGHGKSDHFPEGFIYDPRGYVGAVKKAVTTLGWDKFIYLGHSMGAVVGIQYCAIFPEDVISFISIDIVKPWSFSPEKYPSQYKKAFTSYFDNEKKSKLPPLVYNKEELIKKTIDGSKSLNYETAKILLERGSRKSEDGEGYVLTRDLRAKSYFIGFMSFEAWLSMAENIKCPQLFIKVSYFDGCKFLDKTQCKKSTN